MASSRSKSKKSSGASSGQKQPKPLAFFIDRSLGRELVASALKEVGQVVHIHDDYLPSDARDQEWLDLVGRKDWVVLTRDSRIRYRPLERDALMNAKIAAFILTGGNLQGKEMAKIFVKAIPAMTKCKTKK